MLDSGVYKMYPVSRSGELHHRIWRILLVIKSRVIFVVG
ncbi:hypothetical protein IHI24_000715 [Rickettsia endosymbiont of Cardiosporidium cionae]|nr:hypothetical protein IHI24_000715 [Rickettsia endosymbiont of Cardiosporidium cionae]